MTPLLKVSNVAKAYGGNRVLESVSFNIHAGEIIGVIGPNGSGKSTLLNAISGFTRPDHGEILIDGQPLQHLVAHQIVRHGVARTFQLPAMPEKMTVLEVIMAGGTAHHGFWSNLLNTPSVRRSERETRSRAGQLMERLLLSQVRDNPAAALSGGQKKLLSIACALMGHPRLLMLDEPTAGVHPNLRREMVTMLKQLAADGITLMVVEHDMHFIRELCERCIVLDRGHIVAECTPAELSSNVHVLQAYLGKKAHAAEKMTLC